MKKLTILHISDSHIRKGVENEIAEIVSKLIKDVKRIQNEKGVRVDLVCFTGDLIQRGDQARCGETQWQMAMNEVIDPVLQGLDLPDERFVFVPGNHEVDISKIIPGLEKGLQAKTLDEISLYTEEFHESYRERLAYFYDIVKEMMPAAQIKDLGYTYKIRLNEMNVGIACIDSAWRSSGKGAAEKGNLYIGRKQIDNLYRDISECDVKICMMHHPVEWMEDCEIREIRKCLARFDLVLRGHVHAEDDEQVIRRNQRTVYSTAGKLYPLDRDYNGYSVIDFDPNAHRCRIFLRTYFGGERENFDAALDVCENGEIAYDIFPDDRESTIAGAIISGIQQYLKEMSEKFDLLKDIDANLSGDYSQILIDPVLAEQSEYVKEKEHVDKKKISMADIMAADDNVLLIGKKETGKTTILQMLGLRYCEGLGAQPRIPVYIDMKRLPKGADKIKNSAVRFIQNALAEDVSVSRNDISDLIRNGKVVFLIDNVRNGDADHILGLSKFVEEFAGNRYILTMEEEFFQSLDAKRLPEYTKNFRKIYIQYMGKAQIREMVTRWVRGREEPVDIHRTVEQIDSYCNQINIVKTPFNIALFMVIWDERQSFVPTNEGIVIENYLQILLEKLDPKEALRSEFSFLIKQDFLSFAAHEMFLKDEYGFTQEEFEEVLSKYHRQKGYSIAKTKFDELFFRKNILSYSGDWIVFSHTSFLEYYLALYAYHNRDFLNTITKKGNRIGFRNVISFYSGLNPNCRDLLNDLSEDILKVVLEFIDLVEGLNDVKIMMEFRMDKDEFMASLEKGRYSQEELDALSDQAHPHSEKRPQEIKKDRIMEREAEDFYSLLMMYGSIIKNAELLNNSDRVEHLEYYLYGINMLYAVLVFLNDYTQEHLKFNELTEEDRAMLAVKNEEEFEKRKIEAADLSKLLFPIAIQNLALENIGTPKLEVAINELIAAKKDKPFEKFMLTFLKCDLNITNLKSMLDKYIREENSKDILKIALMKLTFYYLFRFFGNSLQTDRDLAELITEIKAKLDPEAFSGPQKSLAVKFIKSQLDNMR